MNEDDTFSGRQRAGTESHLVNHVAFIKNHVVFINSFAYAGGAANTSRATGMVTALSFCSARVTSLDHPTYISKAWTARLTHRGVRSIPKLKALFIGTMVSEWLSSLSDAPDLIVVLGTDPRFLRPARKWAKARAIPIINDVVDWYQVREGASIGQKVFIALNNWWSMPRESARCDGVVTVSRMLSTYFEKRGVPNVRIPALIVTGESALGAKYAENKFSQDGRMHIAYVGTPGKRDQSTLENLRTIARSEPGAQTLTVHIVGGPQPSNHAQSPHLIEYGRLSHEEAMSLIKRSDFTVLQRPADKRFAKAGFPSKVAESLLLGVPVICNLTSDLAEYVIDEVNGITIGGDTLEDLKTGIARAMDWVRTKAPDADRIRSQAVDSFAPASSAAPLAHIMEFVSTTERTLR